MQRSHFGYVLLAVILSSPLLFTGGNEVLFTVLLVLTLLLSFLFLLKQPIDEALKVPLRLFLAFIGCQLLTLIPIPVSWIRWLSPGLHKVLLNFPEVAYHTLSWDAILTMKTLAIYVAAAGVFLVAYHLWEDPLEKIPGVVQLLFWSGIFWVGGSLWLHYYSPGTIPFLPWQPEPWFWGLFTNSNIFGSYCAFWVPIGLGLALYHVRTWSQAPGMAIVVLLAAGLAGWALFLSRSQGAMLALAVVLIGYVLPKRLWTVPAALVLIAWIGWRWGADWDPNAFESFLERFRLARMALIGTVTLPWVGSGLGTTALVLPRVQGPMGDRIADKVHNDALELLLTSGLSGLLFAAAVAMPVLWILRYFKPRYSVRGGLVAALLTVAVHSLVDFPLQNYSILALMAFCGGLLAGTPNRSSPAGLSGERMVLLMFTCAAVSIAAMVLMRIEPFTGGGSLPSLPTRNGVVELSDEDASVPPLHRYTLHSVAWGERARQLLGQNRFLEALRAADRAVALQPYNPRLRLLRAKLNFCLGDRPAMLNDLEEACALEGVRMLDGFPLEAEELERIVLSGSRKAHQYYGGRAFVHYRQGYYRLKHQHSAVRGPLIEEAARLFANNALIQNAAAEYLLESGRPQEALDRARIAVRWMPDAYNATMLGRALASVGRDREAMEAFWQGLAAATTKGEAWLVVSWMAQTMADHPPAAIIDFAQAGYRAYQHPLIARLVAREYRRSGRLEAAAEWYGKALDASGNDQDLIGEIAGFVASGHDRGLTMRLQNVVRPPSRGTQEGQGANGSTK